MGKSEINNLVCLIELSDLIIFYPISKKYKFSSLFVREFDMYTYPVDLVEIFYREQTPNVNFSFFVSSKEV